LLPFETHVSSIEGAVSQNARIQQPRTTMQHSPRTSGPSTYGTMGRDLLWVNVREREDRAWFSAIAVATTGLGIPESCPLCAGSP
jgi:hypothetical protein